MAVQTKAPACHVKQPPPPSKPYCVGITPALAKQRPQLGSESFFSGLPKATLDTHGPRPQTLLGSRQACRGLSVACPKPASSLRPRAPQDRPAAVHRKCYGQNQGYRSTSLDVCGISLAPHRTEIRFLAYHEPRPSPNCYPYTRISS